MADLMAVQNICGMLDRGEIDRLEFLQKLTRSMAAEMGCARAAVRLLIQHASGPALRSIALYDAVHDTMVRVPDMTGEDTQTYFDALLREGTVVAPNVAASPATRPFLDTYLVPQRVRALLDASFSVNGVLYGAFSCEQLEDPQPWTQQQVNLLRQISGRASLTLMHAINAQIDTTPGALWEPSTPNRLMTMPMPLDGPGTTE
jgi:GAF domain-containing protein